MEEAKLVKAILDIDDQLVDCKVKILDLTFEREQLIDALVELRASRTPIMEAYYAKVQKG